MAHDSFGHWSTIYGYFKRSKGMAFDGGAARFERRCGGRNPEPSAGSIDSQSIKTATQHEDVGDGNKRIKGRKRHILVDTLGLIIAVVVTDASTDDRQGLVELLTQYFADGVKRLRKIWVDGAYPAEWLDDWVRGLKQRPGINDRQRVSSRALGRGTDFCLAAQ